MNTIKLAFSILFSCICLLISSPELIAQDQKDQRQESPRYAIDFSPMSPFIDIYGIHFTYMLSPKDELITGLSYMKLKKECGETNSPALILGYRRYLWNNLHIEYELWPCYDNFHEQIEGKFYPGFDLWNEFRLGYRFDFRIKQQFLYVNLQWPFGFNLYSSNKPESFLEEIKDDRFFYHMPLVFIGIRF